MKLKTKQLLYLIHVPHNNTIQGAFLWWITRKNKRCKSFCPTCHYYFKCQEDDAFSNLMEGK